MRSLLNFLPLFESDPFAGDKEDDDEAIARLLEEDVILPPNLSTRPGCAMDESPSPYQENCILLRCVGERQLNTLSTGHRRQEARRPGRGDGFI